ncbi:PST family polysaccharide transporter [Chryseobacterium rhizosphaerae]|uniref:PST family polysaccharide transporter n=1 Tax=Chryseobacterium rhizosphaerae TaxID=395937 RepID=A0AAE4C4K3_9FLAO|nr:MULTISPECIES: O-antigen translocase [Chryseobacterium]MBL3547346.1 O-antigen translocase [Chryseobacterium sp. KMC2]MDR6527674.1 PST family polysaccharide transporter [Chryseobacterium rhizosphaerae]
MLNKVKKIIASDLVKVFSFTSISTIIKLITGYVSVKIVASIIGPAGITLLGQLQNFTAIFTTLGAGGINNGVVKYVSEFNDDKKTLKQFLSNGFKITFCLSLFFGLILILLSHPISTWILLDVKYYYVFIFLGISLLLFSINNYFLSILNGFKEFKRFIIVNIITSLVGLIFTVLLVLMFHLEGALIANVSYQGVVLFVTFFLVRKYDWFNKEYLWGHWNIKILKKYASYSLMALVSAATVPISQLLIRGYLIKNFSINTAGYWEGMNRISTLYMVFFTTTFGVYYLPKLSEIKNNLSLKNEVIKTYKIIAPLILISLVIVFLLKDVVINLLFTKEFYSMKDLFFWQLLGDFFKIMSWILAFIMVAKSMPKIYILTEIIFSFSLITFSYFFINANGIIGATQAYCLNYFLYFIVMVFIFKNLIFSKN